MSATIAQVLDLLMIVVLVMFIPIGLWRGVLREWVALVGITVGTLLAAEWAGPWGGDLAARTGMDDKMGAFVVGVFFFLGTTLLVGYGGGAALPYRTDLTRANRLLGALLGLGNGTLILSGMLRLMQRHLFDGQSESLLLGTTLSRFLIDDIGWVQLVMLAVLLLCVVVSVLRRWAGGPPLMEEFAPAYFMANQQESAHADEAWRAYLPDEEDTAPTAAPGSIAAYAGPATQQQDTAILQIVPPQAGAAPPESPRPHQTPLPLSPPRTTALVSVPRVIDIARPSRVAAQPSVASDSAASGGGATVSASETTRAVVPAPLRAESAGTGALSATGGTPPPLLDFAAAGIACPVCGKMAAARSRFCHHCGHIIGEAERRRVARQE